MKTNRLPCYLISMQLHVKVKNGKDVSYVPKFVSKHMHFFIKYDERVEKKLNGKRRYSTDLQQGEIEIVCVFSVSSEHEKMLRRFEEYVKNILSKK